MSTRFGGYDRPPQNTPVDPRMNEGPFERQPGRIPQINDTVTTIEAPRPLFVQDITLPDDSPRQRRTRTKTKTNTTDTISSRITASPEAHQSQPSTSILGDLMFKSVTMATRAPTRRRTTFTEATDRSLLKNVLRFKPYAVKSRKRGKVWEVVINSIIEDCKEVRADASMAVMVKSFKYRYHRLRQAWLKKEHMSKPVVDLHQKLDVDTAKYDDNDDDQFKELVSPELNAASDRIPLSHGSSATNSESNINRSVSTFQPTRPVTRALGPAMMAETPSSLSTQQVTPLDYSSYTTDPSPVTTLITPSTSHQHSLTRHASTTSAQCSPQNYLTRTPVSTQLTFDTPTTSGMMITRPDGLQLQKDYIALQRRQVELMEEDMRWKWEFLKVLKEKQIDEATLNLVAGSLSLVPNTGADTALRYDGELVEKGS